MIRDVELIKHLPLFVQEYREIIKIMEAENPEIQNAEDETEIILNNQFIQTCNLTGIAKFESLMGITPEANDTLESRISRVLVRWNDSIPYTFIVLCQKLDMLCGEGNYEIERDINGYTMTIITHLEYPNQVEELDYLLDYMIPANIVIVAQNKINLDLTDGTAKVGSNASLCDVIEISDSFQSNVEINGDSKSANAIVNTAMIEISDNFNETFDIESDSKISSNINVTEII